jgi:glycosyltransferase involved in cell wall biosynthesis
MDYVINAVNALSYLSDEEQPEIEIIVSCDVNLTELKDRINYKRYKFYTISKDGRASIGNWLANKLRWKYIYPFPKGRVYDRIFYGLNDNRKVYWIPDFQEEYFSHLFGGDVVEKRRKMRSALAKQTKSVVVFSSQNAHSDFIKFYGPKIQSKTKVLHFANPDKWSFTDDFSKRTLIKFNLDSNNFFICPNQMWEHKNHKVVFEALRLALKTNKHLKIAFCGKEHDPRNPSFVEELKKGANDLVEAGSICFLGFLPKEEQMCLIKESIALLQPSKFEGWSTTIEDGISLGKRLIASNLAVNIEQLGDKGYFFNPEDSADLAEHLLLLAVDSHDIEYHQERRVKGFAKNLIGLID